MSQNYIEKSVDTGKISSLILMEYPSNFEGYLFFFISVAKLYRKILIYLQNPKQKK